MKSATEIRIHNTTGSKLSSKAKRQDDGSFCIKAPRRWRKSVHTHFAIGGHPEDVKIDVHFNDGTVQSFDRKSGGKLNAKWS